MKRFLIFSLILMSCFCKANAAIKVTPTVIELNANETKGNYLTTSFNIQGDKNEIIRFKIYPAYFKITDRGEMDIIEKSDEADNLIKNTRFVPNEFTLTNGNNQKVRLTITDIKNMQDGESRMVLFLEDVKPKEMFLNSGVKNVSTKLIVKTRVGIPIYLDKGKFVKCAHIENFDLKKQNENLEISLKFLSTGNSKVRYQGRAQIIKDKELIGEYKIKNRVIGSNNILNTTEEIPLSDIKENGNYTLRLIVQYQDEKGRLKSIIKENNFTIENFSNPKV